MATLMRSLLNFAMYTVILLFLIVALAGQGPQVDPVPIWPEDGQIPPQYADRYVFLTADRHTIVVLVPERLESGMAGPKKAIRVSLWKNIAPLVSVSLVPASGAIKYEYTIDNGKDAQDPIGKFSLVVPASLSDMKFYHFPTNGGASWGGPGVYRARGPAVAPHDILQQPLGRYWMWFYQRDNDIQPGATLGGFGLESSYLPGLTTAWFSAGRAPALDPSWPREVFKQLELLEYPWWWDVSVVTIGPMFPPDMPKEAIIASFRQDLEQMIKSGWLDGSSLFVQEAVSILRELPQNLGKRQVLNSPPQTKTETAVASALGMSLGITLERQR